MWHHLRARIDNIRLRVLHPNIQEHQTVDIFRGLPEGSRLSPTLFGIFAADLIHELQTQFPHAVIILHLACNTMGQRKFGLVGCCTLMTSRSCPPARTNCKPCYMSARKECPKSYANQHTEDKSHSFLRDPLPPQGSRWPAQTRPNPAPLPHPRALPNLLPLLLPHYRGTPI